VSAYGYPRATTPNLDRLIREGTSFDAHYAAAPYTHPSLASILTGLLPTALGFTSNVPTVPTNVATLPERLADAGYVAAGFSSQYVLSNRWGLNRGFHYWRNQANDVPAGRVNDELLAWWDTHPDDNSFLWAHHFDPHGPYRPPQGWREKFVNDALWAADTMRLDPSTKAEGVPFIPNYVYDKDQRDRRWYVAGYDGDIAYWDSQLGRLIKAIHDRGWERDTVVLVTADHGESMTEHARFFCHGSLWEHDIHVPMVIWGPGRVPAGKVVSTATGHTQILPTLLDLAGVGSKRGSMLAPDPEHLAVAVHGKGDKLRWAVRGENSWKLIFDASGSLVDAYELGKDPGETVNRAGLLPPEARAITTRFKKALEGPVGVVNTRPEPTLDAEDLERLRALGYIE
jgi:arylsulfatase A-like enzyme